MCFSPREQIQNTSVIWTGRLVGASAMMAASWPRHASTACASKGFWYCPGPVSVQSTEDAAVVRPAAPAEKLQQDRARRHHNNLRNALLSKAVHLLARPPSPCPPAKRAREPPRRASRPAPPRARRPAERERRPPAPCRSNPAAPQRLQHKGPPFSLSFFGAQDACHMGWSQNGEPSDSSSFGCRSLKRKNGRAVQPAALTSEGIIANRSSTLYLLRQPRARWRAGGC